MLLFPIAALATPAFADEAPVEDWLVAVAQDEEDEDGEERPKADDEARIREIVRGFYAKANVGAALYLLDLGTDKGDGSAVQPGTLVGIAFGQDFVDNEKHSMAWELAINQGVHNGLDWSVQAAAGCQVVGGSYACTEGDLRTYSLQASYEFSAYPTRRIGIGARAGAGAMYSPLLLEATHYTDEILPAFGGDPQKHNVPMVYAFGGPTFEYYTKLSHFSVGVDTDVFYVINGFSDLGVNVAGSLKYTF
ncbi:MAG: adventurous gliding motility protein CglE [Deltaproteobacteria bacterium]|nr:adventurous gliding motility protein CglE [Deltaproteobacteria bacterium]